MSDSRDPADFFEAEQQAAMPDPGRARLPITLLTIVLVAVVARMQLFKPVPASAPSQPESQETGVPQPDPMNPLTLGARVGLGTAGMDEAVRSIVLSQLEAYGGLPELDLRIAIVAGELAGADEAIERLDRMLEGPVSDALARDAAVLKRLYSGIPLSPDEEATLEQHHGWFGRVAAVHDKDESDSDRQELLSTARQGLVAYIVFASVVLSALVIGVPLFITGIILIATGRIRRAFKPPPPGGSVYLEMFCLFIGGFLVLSVGSDMLATRTSLSDEHLAIIQFVGPWVLALSVFYPLLRGLSVRRMLDDLGWNKGKGVIKEVFLGLLAYLAGIPIVAGAFLLSLLILLIQSLQANPSAPTEAPSHPVIDAMGGASGWQIVALYLLACVWAPLVEETVFRGGLFRHLRSSLHWVVAALLVGLIFAVVHPQGVAFIPVLGSIGFVFCMAREWRGSVVGPVVAHALHNTMLVTAAMFLMPALVG